MINQIFSFVECLFKSLPIFVLVCPSLFYPKKKTFFLYLTETFVSYMYCKYPFNLCGLSFLKVSFRKLYFNEIKFINNFLQVQCYWYVVYAIFFSSWSHEDMLLSGTFIFLCYFLQHFLKGFIVTSYMVRSIIHKVVIFYWCEIEILIFSYINIQFF